MPSIFDKIKNKVRDKVRPSEPVSTSASMPEPSQPSEVMTDYGSVMHGPGDTVEVTGNDHRLDANAEPISNVGAYAMASARHKPLPVDGPGSILVPNGTRGIVKGMAATTAMVLFPPPYGLLHMHKKDLFNRSGTGGRKRWSSVVSRSELWNIDTSTQIGVQQRHGDDQTRRESLRNQDVDRRWNDSDRGLGVGRGITRVFRRGSIASSPGRFESVLRQVRRAIASIKRTDLIRKLEKAGFKNTGGGEHDVFTHPDGRSVPIPRHKNIAPGTHRSILKMAKLYGSGPDDDLSIPSIEIISGEEFIVSPLSGFELVNTTETKGDVAIKLPNDSIGVTDAFFNLDENARKRALERVNKKSGSLFSRLSYLWISERIL